jgi:hypothetical protein
MEHLKNAPFRLSEVITANAVKEFLSKSSQIAAPAAHSIFSPPQSIPSNTSVHLHLV